MFWGLDIHLIISFPFWQGTPASDGNKRTIDLCNSGLNNLWELANLIMTRQFYESNKAILKHLGKPVRIPVSIIWTIFIIDQKARKLVFLLIYSETAPKVFFPISSFKDVTKIIWISRIRNSSCNKYHEMFEPKIKRSRHGIAS